MGKFINALLSFKGSTQNSFRSSGIIVLLIFSMLVACSKNKNSEPEPKPAPNTGNEAFEEDKAPEDMQPPAEEEDAQTEDSEAEADVPAEQPEMEPEEPKKRKRMGLPVDPNQVYFVHPGQLNVRSSVSIADDTNIVGRLVRNNQVKILEEIPGSEMVRVEIVKTDESIEVAEKYFVSRQYLRTTPVKEAAVSTSYFMIQNIATEKLRVYKKLCDSGNCAHKMVIEADIAVGEQSNDKSTMTRLGYYHITKWVKFYQDGAGRYPSWYDPNYPNPPPPGASVAAWTKKKVLPRSGSVRGAFGWYTAHVGPNPASQWTHGTLGWGQDKTKYIDVTRGLFANLFLDPRSHGCTRTDNETISLVRELMEAGSAIIKIYAKEAYLDPSRSNYSDVSASWDYILTKNGVRTNGEKAGRGGVLARGTPQSQWLEEGTYQVDVMPDVSEFSNKPFNKRNGKNGNVYGVKNANMNGYFLVDAGLLRDYRHPSNLVVGGYGQNSFPAYVVEK